MNHVYRTALIGFASIAIATSGLVAGVANAATDGPRDCDTNAVMYCGAYTKAQFQQKVTNGDTKNSASNLNKVYFQEDRGVTMAEFMSADTKEGYVTKDGKVVVDGKTVATGAKSTGREFKAGSVKDGSLWLRPTSVSFNASQIEAFVNMDGGKFRWAIIKSCGNTVEAVAVATPTPTPTPTPVKPTPKPTPKVVVTPTPTPVRTTPTPTPTPAVLGVTTMPQAGPGSVLTSMVGLGALGYASRAYIRSRKSLKDTIKRK